TGLMRYVLRGWPQAGLPLLSGGARLGFIIASLLVYGPVHIVWPGPVKYAHPFGSAPMALWQGRSRRKATGGRYRPFRKKRRREIGREQQWAFIGPQRLKLYRTKGANRKVRGLSAEFVNVMDRKSSVTKKVKIVTVKANPSNPNFVTRNIITRGATI